MRSILVIFLCSANCVYAGEFNLDNKSLPFENNTDLISFTSEETKFLQEHPVIRFAIDPLWAPIEFTNKKGEPRGMTVEYLQELEKILGACPRMPRTIMC